MHNEIIEDTKSENSHSENQAIPAPTLDYDAYRADLAELELTKEQEDELLLILWNIMCTMCDLSLDMDSVHMIIPAILNSALEKEPNDETTTHQTKEE